MISTFLLSDISDFVPVEEIIRFVAGQSKYCINVTIHPDEQVEHTETFAVLIEKTNNTNEQITIDRGTTDVVIRNDDSKSSYP